MPTWLTALLSFAGVLSTLFLGLIGWRIQLIGKRRTEIAEEALLAFAHAVDAVKMIRSPAGFSSEGEAVRSELGKAKDAELPGESFHVTLWRMRQSREKFEGLRRLHLLTKYHFGDEADAAFTALNDALNKISIAARMGITTARRGDPTYRDQAAADAAIGRVERWENAIWEGAGETDEIAEMIEGARRRLEAVLVPHLRADAALLPVAVSWRAGKAWLSSRRNAGGN